MCERECCELFPVIQIQRHINTVIIIIIVIMIVPFLFAVLSDIEPDFREQLQVLVPMVLAPENIVLKEINGSVITAQELVEYFKVGAGAQCCYYYNEEL